MAGLVQSVRQLVLCAKQPNPKVLNGTSTQYKNMGGRETKPTLSIVIPTYNQALTIEDLIEETGQALRKIGHPYEIIVIDDGSTDLTAQIANEAGAKVLVLEQASGKGAALRKGFLTAEGDIVVTLDADGNHDPREIGTLVDYLFDEDVDVVAGTRFVEDANIRPHAISRLQMIGNSLMNFVILLLTSRVVSDIQSGFRAYRRGILKALETDSSGFEIEAEITLKCLRRGVAFREVPITCRSRPRRNRASSFSDGFRILKEILKAAIIQRA